MENSPETHVHADPIDRKSGDRPVSEVIYSIGLSARDSFVYFAVSTVAFAASLHFFRDVKPIAAIARLPDKMMGWAKGRLGARTGQLGEFGKIFAIAASAGGVVGHIANVPAAIRGWHQARQVNEDFAAQRAEIASLRDTTQRQAEEITVLKAGQADDNASRSSRSEMMRPPGAEEGWQARQAQEATAAGKSAVSL